LGKENSLYAEHWEKIWTHLIGKGFIIFSLNAKELLTQHIPLLRNTSPPYPSNSPHDLTAIIHGYCDTTQATKCTISLQLLKPRTQLNTVLDAGAFCPQTADN
jgi:hypothetical protein